MPADFNELLKTTDLETHRDWISKASVQDLDEYLVRFGHIENLYRMATSQREHLHFDLLSKPHRLIWWTFWVASLTLIVCVIGYWDQIVRLLRALRLWQ